MNIRLFCGMILILISTFCIGCGTDSTGVTTGGSTSIGLTPDAPRNLTGYPRDREVRLVWEPPSNTSDITKYQIKRGESTGEANAALIAEVVHRDGKNYFMFLDTGDLPETEQEIEEKNLINEKTYYYYIYAVNRYTTAVNNTSIAVNTSVTVGLRQDSKPNNITDFLLSSGDKKVELSWNFDLSYRSTNTGGTGYSNQQYKPKGFYIYRRAIPTSTSPEPWGSSHRVAQVPIADNEHLSDSLQTNMKNYSYTDSTVTNGTRYQYIVVAYDTENNERELVDYMARSADPQQSLGSKPKPPTALTGTADTGNGTVSLSWTAPTHNVDSDPILGDGNGSDDIVGFNVYKAEGGGAYTLIASPGLSYTTLTNSFSATGITFPVAFKVRAVNQMSNESDDSYQAEFAIDGTVKASLNPPSDFRAVPSTTASFAINLSWSTVGESQTYWLFFSENKYSNYVSLGSTTNTNYTITKYPATYSTNSGQNLHIGKTYYFKICVGTQDAEKGDPVSSRPGAKDLFLIEFEDSNFVSSSGVSASMIFSPEPWSSLGYMYLTYASTSAYYQRTDIKLPSGTYQVLVSHGKAYNQTGRARVEVAREGWDFSDDNDIRASINSSSTDSSEVNVTRHITQIGTIISDGGEYTVKVGNSSDTTGVVWVDNIMFIKE